MPVREIVKIWNEEQLLNESIDFLHQKTKKVEFPISDEVKSIIQDLTDSYKEIPCAGIAANQIGYNVSIFIGMHHCDDEDQGKEIEKKESEYEKSSLSGNDIADNCEIYINPKIDIFDESSKQCDIEGCLSVPSLGLFINRYDKIKVRYYTPEGNVIKKPLRGFMSKLFQHELDHLNGILMVDDFSRIAEMDRSGFETKEDLKRIVSFLQDFQNRYINKK
tara:strand:- start:3960 stop:4619 length:660 start_codon:yes stop_codon:yes gene_type:complete